MNIVIQGYAARFGEKDLGDDVICKGAFVRNLSRRGIGAVRMLYQHDSSLSVGHWENWYEDDEGLWVRGVITACIPRLGVMDGLSIGFKTVRHQIKPQHRLVLEVDLWEISLVVLPMQLNARFKVVASERETA